MKISATQAAAVWAVGLVAFALMALLASAHDTFPGDVWLARRVQEFDWSPWTWCMDQTEDLAQMPRLLWITMGTALVALLFVPPLSAPLIPTTLILRITNPLLKELIERPRPTPNLVDVAPGQPSDFSFPSGHAQNAMMLYGLLFYLATAHIRNRLIRISVQAASAWIIIVTGFERVYSGSHWPSDVLGGYLAGALVVGMLIAIDRLVMARRAR